MKKTKKKRSLAPLAPAVQTLQAPAAYSTIALAFAAFLIAALIATSAVRNKSYKNPVALWADASSKSVNKRRTHENYGQALSTAGALNEALAQFKIVLALPDDGSVPLRDLYREIGVVYFRMGLIDDSIVAWQTGLRYAPLDPSLLNNLSVAYMRQRRFDDAEQAIRQALVGAPQMPQALNSLGEVLMIKGNYQEALTYFQKAIEVSPEAPSRYWNAALAAEKTGKVDIAFQYANQYASMEADPGLRQRGLQYLERLRALYFAGQKR